MSDKEKNKSRRMQLTILIISGLVIAGLTVAGILWMLSLRDPVRLAAFQARLESLGVGGWLVLLAIQYVQIVVAFIPGGPIQIVAGALYGPWGGLGVCLAGTLLATVTVFYLVQRFGRRIISLFVEEGDILKYEFLNNATRLEQMVVILYLIPGTPKDALTYIFALTSISLGRFMMLSSCARVPAMLTSVLAGDSIMQRDWLKAGILFAAISCVSLLGLLLQRKITSFYHRHHKEQ